MFDKNITDMKDTWIEVFKAGNQTDSAGNSKDWTQEDLDKIVETYNDQPEADRHDAPVVIGHPVTDSPAYGWVDSLKRVGDTLWAKLKDLAPEFVDWVQKGLYRKRSISLYEDLMLKHISKLSGEYKLDLDAQLAFRNFYPETSAAPDDSDAMLNFKGRMKAHVYKVALILSAAKHDSPVVRGQEMKDAIWIIKQIKLQIERVFRGIGSSQLAEPTARVQLCIEKYGAVTKTELLRVNNRHMTPETLDRVIMILTAIGYCRAQSHQGKVYYSIVTKTTIPTKGIVQP